MGTTIMPTATSSNALCAADNSSTVTATRNMLNNDLGAYFVNNSVRKKLRGKSADMGENIMIMILPGVLIAGPVAGRIE